MALQKPIAHRKNREKIRATCKVLVERETETHYVGRTEHDSPDVDNQVFIKRDKTNVNRLEVGSFVSARVDRVTPFDLFATYVAPCTQPNECLNGA